MKKLTYLLVSILTVGLGIGFASCGPKTKPGPKPGPNNLVSAFKNKNSEQTVYTRQGFTSLLANNRQLDVNKPLVEEKGQLVYKVAGTSAPVQNSYTTIYSTEMDKDYKLNYLINGSESSSIIYASTLDGLYGNTKSTRLIGDLAIGVKIETNADGSQDYYFQLRKDVPWILNGSGEPYKVNNKVQFVNAQDFVDGLFVNLTSPGSKTSYIPGFFVKGASEFSGLLDLKAAQGINLTLEQKQVLFRKNVGIEAIGDDIVKYSLTQQVSFFPTMLTYTCFYPLNYHFYKEKGSKFGETYKDILANGAFYLQDYTQGQHIIYKKNKYYYDIEHVYVDTITKNYADSKNANDYTRKLYEAGKIDSFNVTPYDTVGWDKYVGANNQASDPKNPEATPLFANQGSSTYVWGFNLNRDKTDPNQYVKSGQKTDAEKEATIKAIQNKNFRLGIFLGMDMMKYNSLGKSKTPSESIYRMLFPQELAIDPITGKDYTEFVEKVYAEKTTGNSNAPAIDLVGLTAKKDPVYDKDKALQLLKTAKDELATENVTFPIKLDIQGSTDADGYKRYKDFFDYLANLLVVDGTKAIEPNVIQYASEAEGTASNQNAQYDLSGNIGWGPDYADPLTIFYLTQDSGMLQCFGLKDFTDSRTEAAYNKYFKAYNDELAQISKLAKITQISERYQKFAELEYKTIFEDALLMPYYIPHAWTVLVGKLIPYQSSKAAYGLNSDKFLNAVVTKKPLSRKEKETIIQNLNSLQRLEQEKVVFKDTQTGAEIQHFDKLKNITLSFPSYLRNDVVNLTTFGLTQSDNQSIIVGFFYDKQETDLVENYADDDTILSIDLSKLKESDNTIWVKVLTKDQNDAAKFRARFNKLLNLKDAEIQKNYLAYFEKALDEYNKLTPEVKKLVSDLLPKIQHGIAYAKTL